MKSSLRNALVLVLAVLAGTFLSVRGYLDAYTAAEGPWEAAVRLPVEPTDGGFRFPFPAYLQLESQMASEAFEASEAFGAPADPDCPAC